MAPRGAKDDLMVRYLLRALGHMAVLPFGIRDRVIRRFANPDHMPSTPFECAFFGMRYAGDLARFLDWTVYFYGAYEPSLLQFLRDTTGRLKDPVFVDVGANVGQHTLFMARLARRVHAFEPWGPAAEILEARVRANGLDNVTLHRVALSDTTQELTYYAPVGANTGTGSFLPYYSSNNRPSNSLPAVAGDEYFAEAIPRVDLIKIDVEGYETRVLSGLRGTIARDRPIIVLELSRPTLEQLSSPDSLAIAPNSTLLRLSERRRGYALTTLRLSDGQGHAVVCPSEKLPALSYRTASR